MRAAWLVLLAACAGQPGGAAVGLEISIEPMEGNCAQIAADSFVVGGDCDEHGETIVCRHRQGTVMVFDFEAEVVSQSVPEPRTDGDWGWCINRFWMVSR